MKKLLVLALSLFTAATTFAAAHPNIILIMVDDFGYECVTSNGGQSYQTPHLDKLAATGTVRLDYPAGSPWSAEAHTVETDSTIVLMHLMERLW